MKISSDNKIYSMGGNIKPAVYINSGETITVETMDCYDGMAENEDVEDDKIDQGRINPATGPIYINGAEAGDTLAVEILDIKLSGTGIMRISPEFGTLNNMIKKSRFKILKIKKGKIIFDEKNVFDVKPMIGVIGTFPAEGSTGNEVPGNHGANMDITDITTGTRVYLPVFISGAMLSMGDIHASMGDGESAGTGVETAGEITVKVQLIKGTDQKRPYIETENDFFMVSSAETVEDACKEAVLDGALFIAGRKNISFEDAYMIVSICCNLKICQIVNPLMTVRLQIPKSIFD